MRARAAGSLRRLAADVLEAVEAGMHSNRALHEHLEIRAGLSDADRGLVTHLVYGVLRHRLRLDAHVDGAADRPGRLGPRLRTLLRIGAYELLELGHPPHAAISEAKAAATRLPGGRRLSGVVGGILATVAARAEETDRTLEGLPLLDRLERRHSIPRWWAGRWVRALSQEAALARARALARPPPVEVCLAPGVSAKAVAEELRRDRPGVEVAPIRGVPGGLALRGAGDVFYTPRATAGDLWVQSGPSQRVVHVLDPRPGEAVLDLCAGRGTKTRQIAALLAGRGRLVAADLDRRRLDVLDDLLRAGKLSEPDGGIAVVEHDATAPLPEGWVGAFDAVLVDAPCTGLGEAARHPEVRYRRRFEDIGACAGRQAAIVAEAVRAVRPGGRLVYAVCSNEPEEGPRIVEALCARLPGLRLSAAETLVPEAGWSAGFFVARLSRMP